jgi:hypothetical protein
MPIIFGVNPERNEVDSTAVGPISYDDVKNHLLAERYFGGLRYKEFVDGRTATIAWSPKETELIVGMIRTLSRESRLGPTAVLVSTDLDFGMVRMLEAILEDVAEIKPFRDEQEARSWLARQLAV